MRIVVVHPDAEVLAEATAARLLVHLVDRQSLRRPVHLVLTGGTVGVATLAAVARSRLQRAVDWTGVHLWWGDERFLPTGDKERNETQARAALLDVLGGRLPAGNVHPVPGPDAVDTPEQAATVYAAQLAALAEPGARCPAFDVLLLGMGPDGHVASLFPGNPALAATGATVVGVRGAAKPPPLRVSLTVEAIQAAREVWVVAAGTEKAPAVASALGDAVVDVTPAVAAVGTESTRWLIDAAAARDLP